jgi:hypothetical protein
MQTSRLERRITIAGLLIAFGLLVQTATHFWAHPLSFMTFLLVGAPMVAIGIVIFLISLVSDRT